MVVLYRKDAVVKMVLKLYFCTSRTGKEVDYRKEVDLYFISSLCDGSFAHIILILTAALTGQAAISLTWMRKPGSVFLGYLAYLFSRGFRCRKFDP